MNFNAELISFKLMNSSGTLRIALDVPEVAVPAVMSVISSYLKQPLIVSLNIDNTIPQHRTEQPSDKISASQIKLAHTIIENIAKIYNQDKEVVKSSCKQKFLGSSDISTKDLTKEQADIYIDKLKLLEEKNA